MNRFRRILLCCCMVVVLALTGCAALLPAVSTPKATPLPTPTPAVAQTSDVPNPLGVYLNGFSATCAPFQAQLTALSDKDAAYVEKSLALQAHIQHLRELFLAPSQLFQDEGDSTQWSGMLFGALDGTGTVTTIPGGYSFDCALTDDSQGDINGTLKDDRLAGEWAREDGEIRRGEIVKTAAGYFSLAEWGEERTALSIENGVLYFGADVTASASSLAPQSWAGWSIQNGAVLQVPSAATASSATTASLGGAQ